MNGLKHSDGLSMDANPDPQPTMQLIFECSEEPVDLFSHDPFDSAIPTQLFPDSLDLDSESTALFALEQPIIRLLPDNPSEEAVLRLKVQLLEAKLAHQNAQIDFAERIDVDHLEWKLQKSKMAQLQVGNFLLIMLSLALMICAGCLVVIRL